MDRRTFLDRCALLAGAVAAPHLCAPPVLAEADPARSVRYQLWSEAEGTLARIACMLSSADGERVWPTLARLLAALRPQTEVEVLCADRRLLALVTESWQSFDPARARPIRPWLAGEVQSLWVRDRLMGQGAVEKGCGGRLLQTSPLELDLDARVPQFVAQVVGDACGGEAPRAAVGPWEGGDLLADRNGVLVGGTTLRRAQARFGAAAGRRLGELAAGELGRQVTLVPDERHLPATETWFDYHLDMLVALTADGSVLLGDPDLGDKLLAARTPDWTGLTNVPRGLDRDARPRPDRSEQRRRLAGMERALAAAGRTVHRVPLGVVPDRPWMLSYTNVLQEEAGGERIVYLPQYGVRPLDEAAAEAWRARGYRVQPIAAAPLIPLQGALRCLVSVLQRRRVS